MRGRVSLFRLAIVVAILATGYFYGRHTADGPATNAPSGTRDTSPRAGSAAVEQAFQEHRSGIELEATGLVTRLLPDDREGARHQRFIVRFGNRTVLVAHNLDLAPKVPVEVGDSVELRGEYEWNDRGGVIHWTHPDPAGHHAGGWIRVLRPPARPAGDDESAATSRVQAPAPGRAK